MDIRVNENTVICFDLDDTLYNEMSYLKSAYAEIAKFLDGNSWKPLYARMVSLYQKGENVFEYLVSFRETSLEVLLNMYRSHFPEIQPFDGVVSLFEEIKKRNGKIGIITDGRSITQRNKIEALGLSIYIDKVIISDEIGTIKPAKENYEIVERAFPNCSYTYVGDNFKKDFVTPNARGWCTIGLLDNGLNIHNNTFDFFKKGFCPSHMILHISEIRSIQ